MEKKYKFFLGGNDAEMETIRNLLEENKQQFYEKELTWGAKLSEYKTEIAAIIPEQIPVFIELALDISYPQNSIIVDHHNQNSGADKKTSIEQVADLLDIKLNRRQQLISINDKAYIDGLIEYGATQDEIDEIRNFDRKCQGITDDDERLALLSIKHYSRKLSLDTIYIYALTAKTSPISDRIYKYYRHIFIATPDNKISYSGSNEVIQKLVAHYKILQEKNNSIDFWYGGNLPIRGYFGANKLLTIPEICKVIDEGMCQMERIYSQHIFLFAFTIELQEFDGEESSRQRLRIIHNKLNNSNWEYKPFQISLKVNRPENFPYSDNEIWAYNEYNYFYDYIRDTLYTKEKSEELFDNNKSHVSLYYERITSPTDEITYYIKGEIPSQYTLKVDNISLRIFETGIGILSLTLYNTCYKSFEDVLKINDFGRRIYPQFLGAGGLKSPVDATKDSFLCDKIVFNACGINISEEFNTNDFLNNTVKYTNYLVELLKPLNPLQCKSIIDDRMYTLCWHENDDLMKLLKINNEHGYNYEKNDKWYQYVFIDGQWALIAHEEFKNKLILQTTYNRFADLGTLYGISRYSLVCLCGVDPYNDFPYKIIRNHMQKQYYQMAVLLLAQRASIIQFNNEIERIEFPPTKIEDQKNEDENNDKFDEKEFNERLKEVKKLENLDIRIMNFINRMTYNEVTSQEQGIELYNMALDNMQISNQLNILKSKINDLHLTADQILERLDLQEERRRNKLQRERKKLFDKITLIAAIFAPFSLYSTISKFIKPYLVIPEYLKWGMLPTIYSTLWSISFLITLFLLIYCLINDDYSKNLGYKINWFSPLKALMQQFFFWKTKPEIYVWKILLSVFSILLIILSLPSLFEIIKKLMFS